MDGYTQCWLGDFFVGSNEYGLTELISLFRSQDKVIRKINLDDLPAHLERYREYVEEDIDFKAVYYEAPIDIIRDRLDILGYDLVTAKEAFTAWITEEKNANLERIKQHQDIASDVSASIISQYEEINEILSSLSPDAWIDGLREIRNSGVKPNHHGRYERSCKNTLIGYMLSSDWYGFPGYDSFVPLRLAIEAFGNENRLFYDITDLVWSGDFDYEDDFVNYNLENSLSGHDFNSKTIVLTEGKTDAWILSESLGFLYPHLRDYFSFLDFDSTGFGGGVGNLANVVKAFAGAGIVNNIVALFDNDTAAIAACKSLESVSLPSNIVIQYLPELDVLKNYPTIGPSGNVDLDVNGVAASIELYLGEDVLRIDGNKFAPIQWTGYDKSLKKYQGEVLEKAQLQSRFREKLLRAQNGEIADWSGLIAIFELLFRSFSNRNRKIICRLPSEYYSLI